MSLPSSDLILLQLFKQGIADLRANPYYLDFVFEDLIDENTDLLKSYGFQEISRAKSFFLKNDIDVRMAYNLDAVKFPCISIEMINESEDNASAILGDMAAQVAYWTDVNENDYVTKPRVLGGPYPSVNYSLTTGEVTLPAGFDTELIFPNQALFAPGSQTEYLINSLNVNTSNSFFIQTDVRDNFNNSFISPAYKTLQVRREIAIFNQNFNFKIMVQGDPGPLVWVHQIISYLILKYRKSLLERKNLMVSSIQSGPFLQENPGDYGGEVIYSRNISMNCKSEVTWVSGLNEKFEAVVFNLNPAVPEQES